MGEDDPFIKYAKKVTPIRKNNRVKKEIKQAPKNIIKKESILKKPEEKKTKTIKEAISKYVIESGKTNKLLRRGKIKIDRKIDFHGKSFDQAKEEFKKAVINNYFQDKRCLLFVTGKGLLKKNKPNEDGLLPESPKLYYSKIRAGLLEWAKDPEMSKYILTLEKASPMHGGEGAFYIYLRRNKN